VKDSRFYCSYHNLDERLIKLFSSLQTILFNLDFGSNIGAYTLASRKMGNKVIALDPDPENQALLYNSLSKFGLIFYI
jgi:hypothetical protein